MSFRKAYEKTAQLNDYMIEMSSSMQFFDGMSYISIPSDSRITIQGIRSSIPLFHQTSSMTLLDKELSSESYYKSGYLYTSYSDNNMKIYEPLTPDKLFGTTLGSCFMYDFTQDFFVNAEIAVKDGKTYYNFRTNNKSYLSSLADSSKASLLAILPEDNEVKVSAADVEIMSDENGFISRYSVAFSVSAAGYTINVITVAALVDPGKEVSIQMPDDFSSYHSYSYYVNSDGN